MCHLLQNQLPDCTYKEEELVRHGLMRCWNVYTDIDVCVLEIAVQHAQMNISNWLKYLPQGILASDNLPLLVCPYL